MNVSRKIVLAGRTEFLFRFELAFYSLPVAVCPACPAWLGNEPAGHNADALISGFSTGVLKN